MRSDPTDHGSIIPTALSVVGWIVFAIAGIMWMGLKAEGLAAAALMTTVVSVVAFGVLFIVAGFVTQRLDDMSCYLKRLVELQSQLSQNAHQSEKPTAPAAPKN